MANTVVARPDIFPNDTEIKAYLETAAKPRQLAGLAPTAASVETETVASGTATFADLVAGKQYLIHGVVNSENRYLRVTGAGTATIGLAAVPHPSWRQRRRDLGLI